MAKLEVRNLRISFRTNNGAVRAVRGISFDLAAGETLAIVGESGSGKSVTARAIMGILSANAVVEGGEIVYDGRDLLKISEDDFHTLRGHKLAMVFQDPLSALNPIMRIGKQLTEAMLLNNRERRRDGRARFNETLKRLQGEIVAAKGESARAETEKKIKEFDAFVVAGVERQMACEKAREALVETLDCLDEWNHTPAGRKARRDIAKRLKKAAAAARDEYLFPRGEADFQLALSSTLNGDAAAGERLSALGQEALHNPLPDFFRLGYALYKGQTPDPRRESVAEIDQAGLEALDRDFMLDFLGDVRRALAHSANASREKKGAALKALKAALPTFEKEAPVRAECLAAAKSAAQAVEEAIDRLALDKDNPSYVFRTSLLSAVERYFAALAANPREEKRFARDQRKYEALKKRDKIAAPVAPLNLVDAEAARREMAALVRALIARYEGQSAETGEADHAAQAVMMIDYLKARAAEYAYRLSGGMARHRAIEVMDEVGIPEPRKRFHQYPFELSGGMRQRIVIAIALSANPDILICDEPTTALDVTIQAQILELINRLKVQRRLSVLFITHDLGVVANMADRIAVMYAGKIVEYGTADDVFYDPRHPYTWALLSSMPDLETKEKLEAIPGTPPNMILPPPGDAFAKRNHYALKIDFEEEPPMFRVSDTHWAATWLMHPNAPKVEPPPIVRERIARMTAPRERKGGERL